jgi:hypothetical protein
MSEQKAAAPSSLAEILNDTAMESIQYMSCPPHAYVKTVRGFIVYLVQPLVSQLQREQAELQQVLLAANVVPCDSLQCVYEVKLKAAEAQRDALSKAMHAVFDRHSGFDVSMPTTATEAQMRQCQCETCQTLYAALLAASTAEPTAPYTTHGAQTAPMVYSFPDCPHIGPGHWDGTRGRAVCHTCAGLTPGHREHAMSQAIWICPRCERQVSAPVISYWQPNLICKCNFPQSVTLMVLIWPRPDTASTET